jgi:hypothetical protein
MYIYYCYQCMSDGRAGSKIEISCSAGMGISTKFRSFSIFMVPGTVDPLSDWHYREDIWG